MPVFFQHHINENTCLGVWKIEETEDFFLKHVTAQREIRHPVKRLQHLAGRYLLQYLFPDFPNDEIAVSSSGRPFLNSRHFFFSVSHCRDFAAGIVSRVSEVGIDVELVQPKVEKLSEKFLSEAELRGFKELDTVQRTLFWSVKEAVFKWYGKGGVDFRSDIMIYHHDPDAQKLICFFHKKKIPLEVCYRIFDSLVLTWIVS
ncbi:MAG: 4'-phosphopantetheinyl transferase superfamily protein [Chitinophagaceae bacterium]|nr:4'-phosphopantetheinyl transferase superfamily protein [Chitinophagaceae bacterium]